MYRSTTNFEPQIQVKSQILRCMWRLLTSTTWRKKKVIMKIRLKGEKSDKQEKKIHRMPELQSILACTNVFLNRTRLDLFTACRQQHYSSHNYST